MKIDCPLMKEKIDDGICFDISMVAENMAPERTAPEKAIKTEGFRQICLDCPNHRYD